MANSETDFKKELREASKKSLGHPAMYINMRANDPTGDTGKPDIYIKITGYESQWWELKFARHHRCGAKSARLSDAQRIWMQAERNAGGIAAWLVCKKMAPLHWHLYIGTEGKLLLDPDHLVCEKTRGMDWPILKIATHIEDLHD